MRILIRLLVFLEVFAGDIIEFVFGMEYRTAASAFRVFALTIPLGLPLSSAMLRASAGPRTMVVADVMSLFPNIGALFVAPTEMGLLRAVLNLVARRSMFHATGRCRIAADVHIGLWDCLPWGQFARLLWVSLLCCAAAVLLMPPVAIWPRAPLDTAPRATGCATDLWCLHFVWEAEFGSDYRSWRCGTQPVPGQFYGGTAGG